MAELLTRLQDEVAKALSQLPDPLPPFDFRIGWSQDYYALFRREFASETGVDDLVTRALAGGRVLLHARGGGGKTVILTRLLRGSLGQNRVAVYVDLRKWTPGDYEMWRVTEGSQRLSLVLRRFGMPTIGQLALESLSPSVQRLVLIDGLNEVVAGTAQEILEILDDFARHAPSSGVVVTDRLVRRELPQPAGWQLATILPLTEDEIRARLTEARGGGAVGVGPATLTLLDSPYFLDAALHGDGATSAVEVHNRYFTDHIGLTPQELVLAASAAFQAYERSRTRTFRLDQFQQHASHAITEKLQSAGALVPSGDQAFFAHHLKHDYLAAQHLARSRDRWTDDVFNIVTLRAASFDCLEMTLQLLTLPADGDAFIRAVYDWNQYAAAYALAEGRHRGRVPVSPSMEIALLAMLAERRWDLISATAERVTDALQLFGTAESQELLGAESLEGVVRIVRRMEFRGEFEQWKGIFCRSPEDQVLDQELEMLLTVDSLVGWTLSNVLKRLRVGGAQQGKLRSMLETDSRVGRWRIVHALGAFPSMPNARALLRVVDGDEYAWARYGAIRSVIEIAARGDERLRRFVFTALKERVSSITKDERILREFERAIFVDPRRAPGDWSAFVIDVCRVFHDMSLSLDARDHWERVAYQVRERYAAG